ncbi:MAG: hypothetical protein AAGK78_17305, partial [Planctomycetota bacterium]
DDEAFESVRPGDEIDAGEVMSFERSDGPVEYVVDKQQTNVAEPVRRAGPGLELWLSLIGGLICVLLGMQFFRWFFTTLGGGTYNTGMTWSPGNDRGMPADSPVAYYDLVGGVAWTETGLALFGVALLVQAGTMLIGLSNAKLYRGMSIFALGLTLLAMVLNVVLAVYLLTIGITPITSLLLLLFGVFLVVQLYDAVSRPAVRG